MRTLLIIALTFLSLALPAAAQSTEARESRQSTALTRLWRFRNETKTDLDVWVRFLDVPWSRSAALDNGGQITVESGKLGVLNPTFTPIKGVETAGKSLRGKALIVFAAAGTTAGSQWLVHEFSVDDRPSLEPVIITDDLLSQRRDVLFIRNDSSRAIHLSTPVIRVPSESAAPGKDFILRTTGTLGDDSIVIAPGKSAPWLVLNQTGSIGAGPRLVRCSLRTDKFTGRCSLEWKRYYEAVIAVDDEVISSLATDAQRQADELAQRKAEQETAKQVAAQHNAEAEQARRAAAEQRRQRTVAAQRQQDVILGAAALVLGALLINELLGDAGWSQSGSDDELQQQYQNDLVRSQAREREEREADEARRRVEEAELDAQWQRMTTPDELGR